MAQHAHSPYHLSWKHYRARPAATASWEEATALGEEEARQLWSEPDTVEPSPLSKEKAKHAEGKKPKGRKKGKKKGSGQEAPVPHTDRPDMGGSRRPPSPDPEAEGPQPGVGLRMIQSMWRDALATLVR